MSCRHRKKEQAHLSAGSLPRPDIRPPPDGAPPVRRQRYSLRVSEAISPMLLVPQRHRRLHPRCLSRRQIARQQRNGRQSNCYRRHRCGIVRANSIE
jgi:hypothetical protein